MTTFPSRILLLLLLGLIMMPMRRSATLATAAFQSSCIGVRKIGGGRSSYFSTTTTSSSRLFSTTKQSSSQDTTTTTTTASTKPSSTASPMVNNEQQAYDRLSMDDLVSLCKRRGFIFPSSDIYNGYAGFYDYGPLGVELKMNVKQAWWHHFVTIREDVVGLDSSIIHNPATWASSGHLDGFSDPMVDCKETKLRFRADQLLYGPVVLSEDDTVIGYVCVHEGPEEEMKNEAAKQAKKLLKENDLPSNTKYETFVLKELVEATEQELSQIPSPASGKPTLTPPRDFNLMFQTSVGAATDASSTAYLRPETAQGIFLNFKNALTTSRQKIPFGIAQMGKAFRNEITPRNFIFRSREFEQMEVEYFIPPGDESVWKPFHEEWMKASRDFLENVVGLRPELLDWDVHEDDKLAHYARACTDITFRFPFGTQELMGIAARGDYDLQQHSEGSGKSLEYFDEQSKEKFVPHCIEPSLGVDRLILALICSAYAEDEIGGEKRTFLKFHPRVAPIKASVLPLVKNKPELVGVARQLFDKLRMRWNVSWDATGAIGRRYRRADEVGTPFCITVDFDTIEKDNAVTIRDRDSTEQVRVPIDEVMSYLGKEIDGW